MHPRAAQGAPTHPAGLGKVAEKAATVCCIAPLPQAPPEPERSPELEPESEPEPEPESEPEPAGAEDEISAESGDYAAQFQAKFFAA